MEGIGAIGRGGVSRASAWMQARYYMSLSAARSAAANPARAETPVEPVQPVKALPADVPVRMPVAVPETRLPTVEDLNNASEHLARMRIEYPGDGAEAETPPAAAPLGASGAAEAQGAAERARLSDLEGERAAKENELENGAAELEDGVWESKSAADIFNENRCETCAKRRYQDGSDDPGVSFKSPTHISPEQAETAVRGHEMEHVVREQAKAEREGREVVSQSVSIHTAICPECGRVYISGGTTRTVTMGDGEGNLDRMNAAAEGETEKPEAA